MTCACEVHRRDGLSDIEVKRRLAQAYHLLLSHPRPKDGGECDSLDSDVRAEDSEVHTEEREREAGEQH